MINFGNIIKRAWQVLWNYKVLWIFGILLVLTAGGVNSSTGSGSNYQLANNPNITGMTTPKVTGQPGALLQQFNTWAGMNLDPLFSHPEQHVATLIWIGVGILLFALVVQVLSSLVRYPTESAIIRMVDEHEQTGTKLGFKQGWKLGWTRRAFRMWVIDLVLAIPVIVFVALLGGLGWVVYSNVKDGGAGLAAGGIIAIVGCGLVFLLGFIVLMVLLTLLRQFFIRQAALEGATVGESLRNGWAMFKRNFGSASIMWLIMLGFGIAIGIAGVIVFFLLIPAYVVLLVPALLVAAIPGFIVYGIASIFTNVTLLAIIIGALAFLPFFFTVLFSPLLLVSGWYKIFESNIWTLSYREMKMLGNNVPPAIPAPVKKKKEC